MRKRLIDTYVVFYNVAAKFGVPSQPPYLSLYMTDNAILQGVNFASGGAGILNETGIYFVRIVIFFYLNLVAVVNFHEFLRKNRYKNEEVLLICFSFMCIAGSVSLI